MEEILSKRGLSPDEVIYIGDDINDTDVMRYAKISVCPQDASLEVKKVANIMAKAKGGEGVLRWVVDTIIENRDNV